MRTILEYDRHKTARARIRDGCLVIKIPVHWPKEAKEQAIARFTRWAQSCPQEPPKQDAPMVDPKAFEALVHQVNQETLNLPIEGVRLGKARYTRLAQINLKTRILTFSRYAVGGMPPQALRYLIIHELAHLIVPNHSRRFWEVVGCYEPNYKVQRQIALDHFRRTN